MTDVNPRPVPDATVSRLPLYLRVLAELAGSGETTVSSDELAEAAGVTSAKVRKDLSALGSYGTRGIGYDVDQLIDEIRSTLGLTQHWSILITGVGNLGLALARYRGFAERGFRVAALLDVDPTKVGTQVADLTVRHLDELPEIVRTEGVAIGVIATPAAAAQDVADRMVASGGYFWMVGAGIRSILNFAPASLAVPEPVTIRKVDLAIELQILSYYEQRDALRDLGRASRAGGAIGGS
jgi:redox-sensing transcriptional repressor